MGRLSDFECRVDMCFKLHDADAANVQQAEIQVQQQLLQSLLGMSVTPVQAVAPATDVIDCLMSSNGKRTGMHAQQGCIECTRKAQQFSKLLLMHLLCISFLGSLLALHVLAHPLILACTSCQQARRKGCTSTCSASKLPRKDIHNRGGC